jgi:hypothetical protein
MEHEPKRVLPLHSFSPAKLDISLDLAKLWLEISRTFRIFEETFLKCTELEEPFRIQAVEWHAGVGTINAVLLNANPTYSRYTLEVLSKVLRLHLLTLDEVQGLASAIPESPLSLQNSILLRLKYTKFKSHALKHS